MSISKFISIILHPIFMPFAAIYLSIKLIPGVKFTIAPYIGFIYLILIFSTIILPLISVLFLINQKRVSSIEMSNFRERPLPLFIAAICMVFGYYKMGGVLIYSPILKAEIMGAIIIIISASAISRYWKISVHMLGIGGVIGVMVALNSLFGGLAEIIMLLLFLGGALGVARLKEQAHNKMQIYTGFLIGFLIELTSVLFL